MIKRKYKKTWLIQEYCKATGKPYASIFWTVPDIELAKQAGLATGLETKKALRVHLNNLFTARRHQPNNGGWKRKPKAGAPKIDPNTDAFLESYEWRRVRMVALKRDGARCGCCGATPADGLRMHVDHIKPRRKFPELALDPNNLQVLCEVCNHGKGNWDDTDWRAGEAANDDAAKAHMRSIVGGHDGRIRAVVAVLPKKGSEG